MPLEELTVGEDHTYQEDGEDFGYIKKSHSE
jgi:hypothetical protein